MGGQQLFPRVTGVQLAHLARFGQPALEAQQRATASWTSALPRETTVLTGLELVVLAPLATITLTLEQLPALPLPQQLRLQLPLPQQLRLPLPLPQQWRLPPRRQPQLQLPLRLPPQLRLQPRLLPQ